MKKIALLAAFSLVLLAFNTNSINQGNQIVLGQTQADTTSPSTAENTLKFDKYCNARFGYCIDYPHDVIFPQPESSNGDGRVFKNKQGHVVLTVFGRRNDSPDGGTISLEQQFDDDLHSIAGENGNVVTYQKLGKTFFVISGYIKGKIFYQKTILKEDAFAYAILDYSENEKSTFDKVSERIFKSFK
jgi:hypothetical protein